MPCIVVQHLPATFTHEFALQLGRQDRPDRLAGHAVAVVSLLVTDTDGWDDVVDLEAARAVTRDLGGSRR